jgi:hypothetical protein
MRTDEVGPYFGAGQWRAILVEGPERRGRPHWVEQREFEQDRAWKGASVKFSEQNADRLRTLFREAWDKLDAAVSLDEAEPQMVALLEEIKTHEEHRAIALELFRNALLSRRSPWEMVQFCMHDLRWPEMRDWLEKRHDECDSIDECDFWVQQLDAFKDDWEDAVFYHRYRKDGEH